MRNNYTSVDVKEIIEKLVHVLSTDKEYYRSWVSNLAMAYKDTAQREGSCNVSQLDFRIANKAAKLFLSWLTYKNTETGS